jgi:hypothetical protein
MRFHLDVLRHHWRGRFARRQTIKSNEARRYRIDKKIHPRSKKQKQKKNKNKKIRSCDEEEYFADRDAGMLQYANPLYGMMQDGNRLPAMRRAQREV